MLLIFSERAEMFPSNANSMLPATPMFFPPQKRRLRDKTEADLLWDILPASASPPGLPICCLACPWMHLCGTLLLALALPTEEAKERNPKRKRDKRAEFLFLTQKKDRRLAVSFGSPCWTRTNDPAVNSRMLYQLS